MQAVPKHAVRNQSVTKSALHFTHIPELDGIRGIAALMVVFHHLCFTAYNFSAWHSGLVRKLAVIGSYGDSGVDVFFVLSGFLITSLLIRDRESPRYYQDFYWKRALRILPLYLICILGLFIFQPEYRKFALLCLLFLANFAQVFHVSATGPFWTLAIEEQFYLLWPTIVRRRAIASLRHWALAIIVGAIALRVLFACFGHYNYHLTFLHCDGLALGSLIACILERCQRAGNGLIARKSFFFAMFGTGVIILAIASAIPVDPKHIAFNTALSVTANTLFCGALVGLAIAYSGFRRLAWLRSKPLTFFGLISYALYMFHAFVRDFYDKYYPLKTNDVGGYFVRIGVVFAASVVLSLLSRYAFELPIMGLRKYVLRPPAPAQRGIDRVTDRNPTPEES